MTNIAQQHEWINQAELVLANSDVLLFRTKATHTGMFDEAEMQLVWQRAGKVPLVYLVGSGHAGYDQVQFHVRDDDKAIWLVARNNASQDWKVITSLDLSSGEFHAEGDFGLARPESAWAMVHEENGILIEKQLTWTQDDQSGVQRLFDHKGGLLWEKTAEQNEWQLKSGSLKVVDYPSPQSPYKMTIPDWLKAMIQN